MNAELTNIGYNKTSPCKKIGFGNDLIVVFAHQRPGVENCRHIDSA